MNRNDMFNNDLALGMKDDEDELPNFELHLQKQPQNDTKSSKNDPKTTPRAQKLIQKI